ncbi:hypothetical protein P43SY_006889 [Pythium insidiosum]|uniref:Uncharacterized protein n=1 Tax=Pythium insidiosum TaxID=114742 RepID=A0AAD5QE25_PYTIN|nr:hypothetical protein P43SY_006889 [Pythium insidiosum]
MVRDLQQQIDVLLDRAEGGSLEALSPDGDAILFSRALRVLTDAADGDTTALQHLVTGGSADPSLDGGNGSSEATRELASLQARITDLETHVGELTDAARARSVRIEGLQQALDAYRSFGDVDEVQASLDRWRAIAGVLLRLVIDSEQVCARLLAGLVELGVDPEEASVDLHTAIKALRRREGSADLSGADLSDLRQHPLMTLLQSTGRSGDASGPRRVCSLLELLDKSALTTLYESLRSAGRVPLLNTFESVLPGGTADGAVSARHRRDDASGGPSKTKSRRTVFLDRRRKRNSDLTPCWLGHLELFLKAIVTSELDADVLLDPFFIWPSVFGVELAVPLNGQPAQSDSQSSKPGLPVAPDVPPAVSPAAAAATPPSRATVGLVSTPATEI